MLHAENVFSIMYDVSWWNVPCNIRDLIYIQLDVQVKELSVLHDSPVGEQILK